MGILTYLNPNAIKDSSIGRTKLIEIPDYETFDDITKLSNLTAKKLLYVGESEVSIPMNVANLIEIQSSVLEVDFQDAVIKFTKPTVDWEQQFSLRALLRGHSRCRLQNVTIDTSEQDFGFIDDHNANIAGGGISHIQGFGYVDNCFIINGFDCADNSFGFRSCDHLTNCKVGGYNAEIASYNAPANPYSYCNYLIQCRVDNEFGGGTFANCNFIFQCYVTGSGFDLSECSNIVTLIRVDSLGNIVETWSNDKLIVGGYDMTNMLKTISTVGGTGKTKLYAKPDDKSGIATVLLDTTPVSWAVARRTPKGTIKAKDAIEDDDLVTKKQLDTLEAKNTELVNTITELEPRVTNAVQITYAELKSLRDAGKLIPGQQYHITDYTCTTIQENTRSAGHPFDIIVTADDESTLNEVARAALHTGDEYFSGCNLNAWKLWYCLDNDSDRFAWAGIGELIGTIKPTTGSASGTYTYNSPISKVMFADNIYALKIGVRTLINPGPPVYITKTDDYTLVVEDEYGFVNGHLGISVYTVSQEDKGVIYRMIDEFNNDVPYDFKNIQFKHPNDTTTYPYYYYTFASSNVEDNTDNSLISNNCYSNTIKKFIYDYNKRKLNCIIFIGGMCYNNTFGNDCYSNTFGNNCYSNTFGNDCSRNTFEYSCQYNTFGNYCYNNTFGNVCKDNTFGNYCRDNTFGHECLDNSFGCGCKNIKFASDSSSAATKYEYYQNNHFGDGCQYILFKGKETASNSQRVQNYNFAQGLQGADNEYLTIDGVRGRSFETKVAMNSNGEMKTYCEADLIK